MSALAAQIGAAAVLLAAGLQPPGSAPAMQSARGFLACNGIVARIDEPSTGIRGLYGAPDRRLPRVGEIPASRAGRLGREPTSFPVYGGSDGWLLLSKDGDPGPERWVIGLGVSTGVSASVGRLAARAASLPVIRTRDGSRLDRHAELLDIVTCDGDWILGRWRIDEPAALLYPRLFPIWQDPDIVEFWTPACNRNVPGCDAPRLPRRGPRNPHPYDAEEFE
ncbi:MAG: hypothetical protein JO276_12900 [Sphingomonadaceae bacterium]|nr:hypothetical protein [Sphingomonadaceae bacterium]